VRSKEILSYSILTLALCTACVLAYSYIGGTAFLFIPLCVSAFNAAALSQPAALGVLISYIAFEGMLKVLSDQNPVLHVGTDIIVIIIGLRVLLENASVLRQKPFVLAPYAGFFLIHFIWVTIEILNPYGLGLIPGLAAYKVYLVFVLLYFFTYSFLEDPEELRSLVTVVILIALLQAVASIYQFSGGAASVLNLGGGYKKIISNRFIDLKFRPFGTSAIPGGPSVWAFLTMPLIGALALEKKGAFRKFLLIILMLIMVYTLIICQVRASIFKTVFGIAVMGLAISWRRPFRFLIGLSVVALFFLSLRFFMFLKDPRFMIAQARLESLYDIEKLRHARQTDIISMIVEVWEYSPLGIGLSRVGAGSGPFQDLISKDAFFGTEWSFADNLYRELAIELGIPGSIFYLLVVFLPLILIIRRVMLPAFDKSKNKYLVAGALGLCMASIAGYLGSEGALYLPECAYFWVFLGAAVRFTEKPAPRPAFSPASSNYLRQQS